MSHPALDSFGDLDEAARDPHVAGCDRCRDELLAQRQVRDLLASLPDPGPVPPDVVDRLEATLRGLSGTSGGTAGSTVVPLHHEPTPRRRRPWLAAAAAVALLAGGGFGLSRLVPDATGGADNATAGAALHDSAESRAAPPGASLRATASGTSYTRADLDQQVQQVMASAPRSAAGAPQGPLGTTAGIAACLSAIGAPSATPLLVDVARFEGRPAAVVVLPAAGGGRDIWVVSTTCRPGQDGTQLFVRAR